MRPSKLSELRKRIRRIFCRHDFKQDTQMRMVWCPKCGESHFILEKVEYKKENSKWI